MSTVNLELFKINNLFNQFDVTVPLNNINIFLGENGMGKTTILNCLYCVLSGNFKNLTTIVFDSISVRFSDNTILTITHSDIDSYYNEYMDERPYRRRRANIESLFSEKEMLDIRNIIAYESISSETLKKYVYKLSDVFGIPISMATQELERFFIQHSTRSQKGDYKKVLEFKKSIENKIDKEILYFPTYRRIEEDITKLGIEVEKDRIKNRLIQFGMTDVEKAAGKILSTIRSTAITSFAKMTGELLKQYLDGEIQHDNIKNIDLEKLSIALDRVGDEIEEKDKIHIKEMAANSSIYDQKNKYLLNLINRLIANYEVQNQYDERVKKFVKVCNAYLKGKNFVYDESNLELGIFRENTNIPISIQNLSSGEKQVISIFSKLYLEDLKDCIILFDEPELSLSIEWQMKFLPDIMDSGRCSILVAVTHSPFIFDNKFDELVSDMGNCLADRK